VQRILVSELKSGMVTARNVYNAEGRMLLAADKEISASYVRRLNEMGILSIYVRNPFFEEVEVPVVLSEETRIASIQTVKRGFEIVRAQRGVWNVEALKLATHQIVSEIIRNRQTLVHLTEIRKHDDYTFAHSVDVCSIAVLIAVQTGMNESRLNELAMGALLHDIGKNKIDQVLLNKPAQLNEDEMAQVRGHALFGFEILRSAPNRLTFPSMHVALQHHEKFDGTGYPRGLKGDEIHEFSRIVSLADVYDAITSDRPYRKALLPHEACEIMMAGSARHFDPQFLQIFLRKIAIYPIGTVVKLTNGDIGVVTHVEPDMQTRPVLRLIMDKHRRLYPGVATLDMRNHLTVFIEQVVDGKGLFNLV